MEEQPMSTCIVAVGGASAPNNTMNDMSHHLHIPQHLLLHHHHHHHQQQQQEIAAVDGDGESQMKEEYEHQIMDQSDEKRTNKRRDTWQRRFSDLLLRLSPAILLVSFPFILILFGFCYPSLFFAFVVIYLLYSLYILVHNFYYGMIGIRRAKQSRFVNFYQKYLHKQRSMMKMNRMNNGRVMTTLGGNGGEFISSFSSSSDEELQCQQQISTRFKRTRVPRQSVPYREDDVWNKVVHFVIIPNFNERESILRQSLNSLAQQSMARRQIIPVLAMEAREVNVEQKAKRLVSDYILQFRDVLYTIHPANLPDESPGKGSNSNYAWQYGVKEYIEQRSMTDLDPNYCVVTVQDADSIYHENHFDALTYSFLVSHLYGTNNLSIWQPPMICYRNFNEIPAMTRMISFVMTIHELAALNNKNFEKISFSTYSMSHNFLCANNGWDTKYITEDWHCTIRTFFNSGGRARVYSLPFPVSCYSTQGETYYESLYERYIQGKRHALALTEVTYTVKRILLTWMNKTSIPDYVKQQFHKFDSKYTEGSADEEKSREQQLNTELVPNFHKRTFKLFWNVTSVQFIGGTQLTLIAISLFFAQYYSWFYDNADMNDSIHRVIHLWLPLYKLVNVFLIIAVGFNMYMNGQLIALVNGREYQHRYYWLVHLLEWWIFSYPGTLLFNLIPTYIAAFRIIFEERFYFQRSIKPEAPHIYRKKKITTAARKSKRISLGTNSNQLSPISNLAASINGAVVTVNTLANDSDYVIDIATSANSTSTASPGSLMGSRKKKKNNMPNLYVDVTENARQTYGAQVIYEGTSEAGHPNRSDSSSSLTVSNSCSEDEKYADEEDYKGASSDSSMDSGMSPLASSSQFSTSESTNNNNNAISGTVENANTSSTKTSRSKSNTVKVEVVVAVR